MLHLRQRHCQQVRVLSQRSAAAEDVARHGHRKGHLFDQGIHSQNSGGGSDGHAQTEQNVLPASLIDACGHRINPLLGKVEQKSTFRKSGAKTILHFITL